MLRHEQARPEEHRKGHQVSTRTDVVVVGAGLGGLACAADLASRGVGVTVVERHSVVGGYASAFTRSPFVFDISQHSVGGLGEGQSFRILLERLGVADRVGVVTPAAVVTMVTPDGTLELPNGGSECFEALASLAPEEGPTLRKLLDTCASIHRDTVAGALENDMRSLIRGMRLAGDRTFREVLEDAVRSPRLRSLLAAPWVLLGLPPSRASFSWFAKVLATTYVEGTAHIVGGGQALSDALAERIRSTGGEIRTAEAAIRIQPAEGRTASVQTQKEHIEARAVVAAIDPWSLAELLDDGPDIEPAGEPSLSMFALYLGLDRSPSELGTPQGAVLIRSDDPEMSYKASLKGKVAETDVVLSNPTELDPGCVPGQKGMLHAVTLVNGRPWFDLQGKLYLKRKQEAMAVLLDRLERLYPGLSSAIEVKEAATPRTMHGYTRNHLGAVYGLAQTVSQSGARRPGSSTPVPGLFRAGAWVVPGGGYSAATLSGFMTGRDVARHLGLSHDGAPGSTTEEGRFRLQVFYEDTDTDGLTYHVSYLRFFDRARTEMFMQIAEQRGVALPRAVYSRIDVRYHRPSTLRDEIDILTRARFESDFRVVFEQEAVLARDGIRLAEATTDLAFVDEDGNPVPCPIRRELEGS